MKPIVGELEGQCLIASPRLTGDFFRKSIVLVTHHEATGSLGVIFNRPSRRIIGDLMDKIPQGLRDAKIYEGGPVEKHILTIIGISFQANYLRLQSHLSPEEAAKFVENTRQGGQIRGFLGYAGWAPGQLEEEILSKDWLRMPLTPALIEPLPKEKLWQWAYENSSK